MMKKLHITVLLILGLFLQAHCIGSAHESAAPPNVIQQGTFKRGTGYWTRESDKTRKDFFGKLTDPASQREDWYQVSPYIAEFWCTLTNIGFLYVGLKHQSPELIFAGIASIASHSIPKQWLLYIDKLGVAVVLSKVLRNYKAVAHNPTLWALATAGVGINALDAYLARTKCYTAPHLIWHLSSAYISHLFLQRL
jgi:hypothetical protein